MQLLMLLYMVLQWPSQSKLQLSISSDFLALTPNFQQRPQLKPLWEQHMGLRQETFICIFRYIFHKDISSDDIMRSMLVLLKKKGQFRKLAVRFSKSSVKQLNFCVS